jgi:3'(2'), 5'-bisphosphate nucleotidase
MLDKMDPRLVPMVEAVRAAGRICRAVQADLVHAGTVTKGDRSPVTVADFGSQAVVARHLAAALPDLPLVAEEDSELLRTEEHAGTRTKVLAAVGKEWPGASEEEVLAAIDHGGAEADAARPFLTLDPIDGTKGFLRGEQYAVALGLIEKGKVVAGVLGCPNLEGPRGAAGAIFAAAEGKGTVLLPLDDDGSEPEPVRVSPRTEPREARFCESVEKAHSHRGKSALIAEALGVTVEPVRIDSQCKYALVARGAAELYLRIPRDDVYREKIWDHAGGAIVVTEAGGKVTDLDGKPLDFGRGRTLDGNRGVVASNGPIHDAVLAAARRVE